MLRILSTSLAGLFGLAFGSFLNVCVSRWPEGESIVRPGSHCRFCDHELRWWENVPLLSWLLLRGKCRSCGTSIGVRYVLVEAAVGSLWAWIAWHGWIDPLPAAYIVGMCFFTWVTVALAALDSEYLWLPNALTIPATIVGFLWWLVQTEFIGFHLHTFRGPWGDAPAIAGRLLAIALGTGLVLILRWLYWLLRRREGVGLGDAKLMAMLGAWLGFSGMLLAFVIGVLLGGLAALVVLAKPRSQGDLENRSVRMLPLGTFLCVGAVISALWSGPIIEAYLRWSGF